MAEVPATPSAPPVQISPHLTLQAPLSRRGNGPGLVLVLDHYALLDKTSDKYLDPPPLQKWAEEGYAVVQILVPGKVEEDGGEFPLDRAVETLRGLESCDFGEGVGVISYLSRIPFYVEEPICRSPVIKALISYGGRSFTPISSDTTTLPPQQIHIPGPETPRRKSMSIVPESETSSRILPEGIIKTHRYLSARKDTSWILPADEDYHPASATLAHSRTLSFLKPLLDGPYFDLEGVWDEHCRCEFEERDVEATMATMVAEPYVNHIPTLTGGVGKERLAKFYEKHFVFSNPEDMQLELVSRTVGVDRVVDEFVLCATHDRVIDWLLPGVPPTNKPLRIPFTSIVAMRGDRLCHEHISWDQATALRQLDLLPDWTRFPYPIEGREPAGGKRFEVRLPVVGAETAGKLVEERSVESNGLIGRGGGMGWREVDDV